MYLEVDLDFRCSKCGDSLDADEDNNNRISVGPCERCLATESNEARDSGYKEGRDEKGDEVEKEIEALQLEIAALRSENEHLKLREE